MTIDPEQAVYTLVVGLGKTGLSVVRYLRALGENVIVVDSRDIPPGLGEMKRDFCDVEVCTGGFERSLFINAHRIIVSPGVAMAEPVLVEASNNNIDIMGDIDLFAQAVTAPVIGITGSNGKSTVTTLLTEMAADNGMHSVACGNIGTPVLDALDDNVELYVLELSSFQLETLQRLPMKAAVVLNISADHLDRYENIAAYALCKQVIYENAEVLVLNKDDALANQVNTASGRHIRFTLGMPDDDEFGLCVVDDNKTALCFGRQHLIDVDEMKIRGLHNLQNALASLALGQAMSLPMKGMLATIKSFKGLPHRAQFVAEIDGINWINDSKATNVGAAIAAMRGLPDKHILIAGGEAKAADFSELADVVRERCIAVVLIGKDADKIESLIYEDIPVKKASDMNEAVRFASALAKTLADEGDNVLLAPACASFDMFDNFEHRGNVFIEAVMALQSGVSS